MIPSPFACFCPSRFDFYSVSGVTQVTLDTFGPGVILHSLRYACGQGSRAAIVDWTIAARAYSVSFAGDHPFAGV